jgi:hypothetical protein
VSAVIDNTLRVSAAQLYAGYRGELPYVSADLKAWFGHEERRGLREASILAWRIAVKVGVEAVVAGTDWEDVDGLYLDVQDAWNRWHFSAEPSSTTNSEDTATSAAAWQTAIETQGKQSIYVLFKKEDGSFNERRITQRPACRMRVGKLNGEGLRAIWSNQTLELLYLNSDDDERCSIQANEMLLRNLCVSTAPSPFGYPIWQAPAHLERGAGLLFSPGTWWHSQRSAARAKVSPSLLPV